MKKLKITLS